MKAPNLSEIVILNRTHLFIVGRECTMSLCRPSKNKKISCKFHLNGQLQQFIKFPCLYFKCKVLQILCLQHLNKYIIFTISARTVCFSSVFSKAKFTSKSIGEIPQNYLVLVLVPAPVNCAPPPPSRAGLQCQSEECKLCSWPGEKSLELISSGCGRSHPHTEVHKTIRTSVEDYRDFKLF